ncbi:MEDS domain-containing protein [Paucibacter sp. R3-3]|uniref:MEDS domain-containing protein n=1 Tax=Roseateles agri TaxID=3098619 RepID=A0ABU5DPJ4_9BURK|nr:MEDS domain-containing protein [Paucibacter sp. R3-3]MDY0747648.1 MEDS domain-containing protein [Paucibacter sp. R3-3]
MCTDKHAVLPALERMQPGDHYCGIFRSDADQRQITIDFVRLGIERHERMLYLVHLQTADRLRTTLQTADIDVDALVASGQLVIQSAKEVYLVDGAFQPERMIEMLGRETEAALRAGYAALRVTGEMSWALAGDPGSERLVEYEALLNDFYATGAKSYSICQYDQRRFDAELMNDVLHTHPSVLLDTEGFDNASMYYVPPEAFLTADRSSGILETRLANLVNVSSKAMPGVPT